ncbi:Tco5, signal transduction HAMP domain histidine kinase [Serpula lacrymans var. lacrymans S7.3]|uniref:Tco5, signal transduction HAMP domain histidine kinase n=1 Tax=Serpula lacrymans var. lacrymans (strain S7.3) TaxID=936435 RepID=F8QIP8_SERL3|nr:Tco5, signal transduction HAMP domain histidine kinase [Serpula lacrymans var. lacrymans S7.3]
MASPDGLLELPIPITQSAVAGRKKKRKIARIDGLKVHWARFKKRVGTDSPSTSSLVLDSSLDSSQPRQRTQGGDDSDELDEIVVDRDWSEDMKSSLDQSDEPTPEKSGDSHIPVGTGTSIGHESHSIPDDRRLFRRMLVFLRWFIWPAISKFFVVRFHDERTETRYRREHWFIRKSLGFWSSSYFIVNWILGAASIPTPLVLLDKIFFFGIAPVLCLPLLPLVMFDIPRDYPIRFQLFLIVSIFSWCVTFLRQLVIRYLCGFYGNFTFSCGTKNFLTIFYYTTALQTIALFGLKLTRLAALCGSLAFFIFSSAMVLPYNGIFFRNLLNFLLYEIFLLFVHYMNENSERRLFILREQLKLQFKATQKAQINERKAADSKRRLTSYVRVPLNTALLAVQNMEASGAVCKAQELEFMALEGSLVMMSKVLNDMLDFNRMDSGRFEILSKPYAFHSVIRSLFIPLRMATDARNLELVTALDENIDLVARHAAYEAASEDPVEFDRLINENPDEDGVVLGDAIRLRQIINNLASNACKFTPAGGRVTCSTRLVFPSHQPDTTEAAQEGQENDIIEEVAVASIHDEVLPSPNSLKEKGRASSPTKLPQLKRIVVRIEVSDTGGGIPPREMTQGKLFSAFNQTEQGRQQGGKGTGLGLALVRQIVKLSGGRLGVRSKLGRGSTFWVELPLGVGVKVVAPPETETMLNGKPTVELTGPLSADLLATRRPQRMYMGTPTSSALQTLMDQRGLVELNLENMQDESEAAVPTRTIGDLSSGAQYGSRIADAPAFSTTETNSRMILLQETSPMGSTSTAVEEDSMPDPLLSASYTVGTLSPPSNADTSNPRKGFVAIFDPPMVALVVDDDMLTRTIMSRMLSRLGCTVSTADNGETALEMIIGRISMQGQNGSSHVINMNGSHEDSYKYDVVFLDNQMPIMSGLEVVSKLREMERDDFVVGVTGNALLEDQRAYIDAGVDHILTKPVFESSLIKMLTTADERRRQNPSFSPE